MRNNASSATSIKWVENRRSSICELVSNKSSKVDEFTNGQRVLKAAIEHLGELPADWDNYGFEKISSATKRSAHSFVDLMLRKKKFPNAVNSDGIGGITFKWQWEGKKLLVTIKNDRLYYSLRAGDKVVDHDDNILFEGTYTPPEVQQHIP